MTVLLVSADPDFSALLEFLLTYHGFTVTRTAPQVPLAAGTPRPELVLLDLTSLVPSTATAQLASSTGRSLPVLVLSWPEQLAQVQALLPQAVAYLPVPVVPRALVAAVRRVLTGEDPRLDAAGASCAAPAGASGWGRRA